DCTPLSEIASLSLHDALPIYGDGDLRNGCFTVGVEQLCAAAQNTVVLLVQTWQEARDVYQQNQWDIERVTGADETSSLFGRVDVQAAREDGWLVSNKADGLTFDATKRYDDVFCSFCLNLKEFTIVAQSFNNFAHIIRLGWGVWNDFIQLEVLSGDFLVEIGRFQRCLVAVIGRQVSHQV